VFWVISVYFNIRNHLPKSGTFLLGHPVYANQLLAANPSLKPRSRARSWMDTNPAEMKILIGLLILQGIVQKPENGMYFSKRESTVTPYLLQIMTEKRFHLLPKFLHFADNSKFDPDQHQKKFYKIEPILENPSFALYTHQNEASVSVSLSSSGKDDWVGFSTYHRSEACSELHSIHW